MDLSKYPLEKLLIFVAGVIPGFVALLIFEVAAPGSFGWFFALGFLGYKTKLSLVLLAAFLVGISMTLFLTILLSLIGSAIRAAIKPPSFKAPHAYVTAPWRDPRWRTVLRNNLGAQSPNDTLLLPEEIVNLRREKVNLLPQEQRPVELLNLALEKIKAEIDDSNWARWYEYYHQIVLDRAKQDFLSYVRYGLTFNLEAAALYVLISAAVVPSVRHWWCIFPACMWILLLGAEEYSAWERSTDKWSTLTDQIKYLSEGGRGA